MLQQGIEGGVHIYLHASQTVNNLEEYMEEYMPCIKLTAGSVRYVQS